MKDKDKGFFTICDTFSNRTETTSISALETALKQSDFHNLLFCRKVQWFLFSYYAAKIQIITLRNHLLFWMFFLFFLQVQSTGDSQRESTEDCGLYSARTLQVRVGQSDDFNGHCEHTGQGKVT